MKKERNSSDKYALANSNFTYEMENLIDSKSKKKQKFSDKRESAFDYTSINDYRSIFKYSKAGYNLHRIESQTINGETKKMGGIEVMIYYSIMSLFYLLMVVFMPFSLAVCLKKVKQNEKCVVYRLGRMVKPVYEQGYHIIFPLVDSYKVYNTVQKEFSMPQLQVLTQDNSVVELSTVIRYRINDVIKAQNSLQDLNQCIKPIARSMIIERISRKDACKLEQELYFLKSETKNELNQEIKHWGLEIVEIEISILNIVHNENNDGEDPAIKSLSLVFKSLLGGQSTPGPSQTSSLFTSFFPNLQNLKEENEVQPEIASQNQVASNDTKDDNLIRPEQLVKLIEPLINEAKVKDIQQIYEFYIKDDKSGLVEIIFIDLKNGNGSIGFGNFNGGNKSDICKVRIEIMDLNDLMKERVKPFTAYMNGKIEIDGSLQDIIKLKSLLSHSMLNQTINAN